LYRPARFLERLSPKQLLEAMDKYMPPPEVTK
jgi:hypothetical protein